MITYESIIVAHGSKDYYSLMIEYIENRGYFLYRVDTFDDFNIITFGINPIKSAPSYGVN